MDEGNEVLVCASEYVKGRQNFTFRKPKVKGKFVCLFAA